MCFFTILDLHLSDDELKNYALADIEKFLQSSGKSLRDYPPMPFPDEMILSVAQNWLIHDELRYDKLSLVEEHKKLISSLTTEQKEIYDTIMNAVARNECGIFFIYGYDGTEKIFI